MIKFINWFIRPLGYVCVDERKLKLERLQLDQMEIERARTIVDTLNLPSHPPYAHQYMFLGFDYAKEEKPEYKDNVVPFDKHV